MRPNGGRYGFRGCKGLQPSRSGRTIGALILEGVRSLGAGLVDASFVLPRQGMRPMVGPLLVRGCKGLQPSRSGRTIGALILEGVRSLGAVLVDASFVLPPQGMRPMVGPLLVRGCK